MPKFDGDVGVPNVFVPLERELVDAKVDLICKHFQTQSGNTGSTRSSSAP